MHNIICPSILSANFADLKSDILPCRSASMLHIDVMDGRFVPNITIGQVVVESIKKITPLPLDVHLMIKRPEKYVESFVKAGADFLTFHLEACIHADRLIDFIKSLGVKAGVSIVPSTHESVLEYIIEKLDLILVMTVNPGFGGQKFLYSQIKKIEKISTMIRASGKDVILQVDGGIDEKTLPLAKKAGANAFVSGNYIFKERSEIEKKIEILKNL